MSVLVRRTYLQVLRLDDLRPAPAPADDSVTVRLERPCTVEMYRMLYASVGGDYYWRDRDAWTNDGLAAHLSSDAVEIWVARSKGVVAGYAELARDSGGDVEITHFGLVATFHGRGLGGWLLTTATQRAFSLGARRVWLHTCTLDSPAALPNYLARGFVPYKEETYEAET